MELSFIAKLSLNSTQLNFNLNWGWDSLILIKSIIYVAAGLKYVAADLKYVAAGLKYVAAGHKYVAAGLKYVAAAPTRNSIKTGHFWRVQQ